MESSVVLVLLRILDSDLRIFLKGLPLLVMWTAFLKHLIVLHFILPRLVFSNSKKQCGTDPS